MWVGLSSPPPPRPPQRESHRWESVGGGAPRTHHGPTPGARGTPPRPQSQGPDQPPLPTLRRRPFPPRPLLRPLLRRDHPSAAEDTESSPPPTCPDLEAPSRAMTLFLVLPLSPIALREREEEPGLWKRPPWGCPHEAHHPEAATPQERAAGGLAGRLAVPCLFCPPPPTTSHQQGLRQSHCPRGLACLFPHGVSFYPQALRGAFQALQMAPYANPGASICADTPASL